MSYQITDADAYKRGFERGYTLCLSMKKLSREFSAVLKSVVSRDFQHSYGIGLQQGYNEGFRNIKKELAQQKWKEHEEKQQQQQQNQQPVQQTQQHQKEQKVEELNRDKPIDINSTFSDITRSQQRQAEMKQLQQQQEKNNEQERDR